MRRCEWRGVGGQVSCDDSGSGWPQSMGQSVQRQGSLSRSPRSWRARPRPRQRPRRGGGGIGNGPATLADRPRAFMLGLGGSASAAGRWRDRHCVFPCARGRVLDRVVGMWLVHGTDPLDRPAESNVVFGLKDRAWRGAVRPGRVRDRPAGRRLPRRWRECRPGRGRGPSNRPHGWL